MAISSISSVSNNLSPQQLTQEDFLKILLTQLSYQDPLKPMDNQQFMAQMAQFTALQQTQQIGSQVNLLLGNTAAFQSVSLIGRTVDISRNGTTITGTVKSLNLLGDLPTVSVQTSSGTTLSDLSVSQIIAVR